MIIGIPRRARNPVSFSGAVLVTLSALFFLFVYALELFGEHTNPYIGMVFFLLMPGLFVVGLLLIPFGMWRERRREQRGLARTPGWPVFDFNDGHVRRVVATVVVLTVVNVLIVGLATFRGVEYMDSVSFCGQVCHEVMQPEFTSYQAGPHARVKCVECHIGPGAPWFVRSKLSGARQLFAVTFNTHSRPIPSPVQNLRPARDTCEQCHWPAKFHGDKIRAMREYADDAAGTESVTVMRLHVGGGSESLGPVSGIHWHTSRRQAIEYIATDDKRQVIASVRLTDPNGRVKEWTAPDVTPEALAKGEHRRMDCMDCHNRPSHQMAATAERAVDQAIANGELERTLPFIRREAVKAIKTDVSHPGRGVFRHHQQPYGVLFLIQLTNPSRSAGCRSRDSGRAARLRAERVPHDEGHLGHVREQPGTPRLPRLLPVSRRQSQGQGRDHDQPGLRALSQDRELTRCAFARRGLMCVDVSAGAMPRNWIPA